MHSLQARACSSLLGLAPGLGRSPRRWLGMGTCESARSSEGTLLRKHVAGGRSSGRLDLLTPQFGSGAGCYRK